MKVYNKTTARYYMHFNSHRNKPIWSEPFRASSATKLTEAQAKQVVKQLTIVEPALDLIIVE